MSFSINTNVTSLEAQNYLEASSHFQAQTINQVTSGLRIVNSGDDAAGLAVANGLAASQAVLTQGIQNANNGLSTLQTLDGGLNNINTLLDRAQTLATESASGTFSGNRSTLNAEFQSVLAEVNRQAQSIGLNSGGQFNKALSVYIGGGSGSTAAAQSANGTVNVDLSKSAVDAGSLGLTGTQVTGVGSTHSIAEILTDATNKASESVAGQTQFVFKGAGFSDANAIKVSASLTGVTDFASLATAINSAIQNAGVGTSSNAVAFKNANVIAGVTTDANGNDSISFSSGSSAFQVQAGDQTANALLGNFNNQATLSGTDTKAAIATNGGGTAAQLAIKFDGATTATTFTLDASAITASTTKTAIAADLNSQASFSALGKAYVDSANHLIIQSNTTGSTSAVQLTTTTLATNLGLSTTAATVADATAGKALVGTVSGAAAAASAVTALGANVIVRFQGSGLASPVDIKLNSAVDTTAALAIADLSTQVASNAQLQAAGIKTGSNFAAAQTLSFTNGSNQLFSVQTAGDTANVLGFGTYQLANQATATSLDYSAITAGVTTTAGSASLDFSTAGGAAFTIAPAAFTGASTDAGLLNAAFAANTQATAAGLVATYAATKLTITSTNGTSFRVNDTTAFSGFNSTAGATSLGSSFSTNIPQSATLDSGGAQATQSLAFSAIQNGGDTQTLTVSAPDANGVAHTTSVVLQNNATARNGASIDNAISAINTQLQGTNDTNLQGIVAVKENVGGQEQIKFLSTKTFQVSSGTTSSGAGVGSQGSFVASAALAGGSNGDISTAAGATAAINALTAAIGTFGSAQASVGRGENNLNYAVSLASSQVTSQAAAESTIKDANLAQEAANLSKAQILVQAGTAALAQANSAPQQLLSLLKG